MAVAYDAAMETAAKVLIVGGVLNLAYGVFTGLIITNLRRRSPDVPRFLTLAHIGPFMQGPMLLGLALATGLSSLAGGLETAAAWLLVAGSAGIAAGDTLNWLGKVGDAFAERPIGFFSQAAGGAATGFGVLIFVIGVLRGL
jgi:hypothetical protein